MTLPMRVHPARKRGEACPTCGAPVGVPCRVATARTQRQRKVSCAADGADGCGFAVYVSRRQLQRAGVWPCPCCGVACMVPVDPEDAALVMPSEELDGHPAVVEHRARLGSVMHGQAWTGSSGAAPADSVAGDDLEALRRARARDRRLGALRRGSAESLAAVVAAADPMPF